MNQQSNLALLNSRVGHARLWPKKNSFIYKVFYIKVLVTKDMNYNLPFFFSFNRWNLFSLYTKDCGEKSDKMSWYNFITTTLKKENIPFNKDYRIYLISHPRLFGFAFNPISYWIIVDNQNNLRSVLCEVHNTFKQTHNYLLSKKDNSPITTDDTLRATKKLYVSPFNTMEGGYEFKFTYTDSNFKSMINYFDNSKQIILTTYMEGIAQRLSSFNILKSILKYPAMTILVVFRIHWQAFKIYAKGIKSTLNYKPNKYKNNQTTIGS